MEPRIKRRDILQLAPKVPPVPADSAHDGIAQNSLFAPSDGLPKVFSRIAKWAETFIHLRPSLSELHLPRSKATVPAQQRYLFSSLWSLQEGPKATLTFGRRHSQHIRDDG